MKILQVHNFYQQAGGEDRVVADEFALLTGNGHTVLQYTAHNREIPQMSSISVALKTLWNNASYRAIRQILRKEQVDLVHVHNTFPLVSPAVYYAAAALGVPVVQTLHNYRLLCPAATLFRDGTVCELCLHKSVKYPAVIHRCYRDSLPASLAASAMVATHTVAGTYRNRIRTYIALTEFARRKFCLAGLPAEQVVVKPNFLAQDPGVGNGSGQYALFLGRLAPEKGLHHLLDAWQQAPDALPLKIAGTGPLRDLVSSRAAALPNVDFLGECPRPQVLDLLKHASFLVFPSIWYEGLPMVLIEAMACGTPVAAFGIGSLNELILDGINGMLLPQPLSEFLKSTPDLPQQMARLRVGARSYYEKHFTSEANYAQLESIYSKALRGSVR